MRVLLYSQARLGQDNDARQLLALLLRENPTLTVSGYLNTGSASPIRQQVATVLRRLGLPE